MHSLDIRSLSFIAMLSSVLLALGLQIVNRVIAKDSSLRLWAWGASANGAAFILLAARGMVPDLFSIVLANTLLVVGSTWLYLGNRKFCGLQPEFPWYWMLTAATAMALHYFTYLTPSLAARIVVLSAATAIVLLACAATLLRPADPRDRTVRWFVATGFLATSLFLGARAVVTPFAASPGQDFMATPSPINTLSLVFGIALNLVLGIGLPLLISGRMQRRLVASEEHARTLYKKTPAIMHSINAEGRLVGVSDLWLSTFGYASDEVIGRKSSDFLTEASRRYAIEVVLPEFFRTGSCVDVPYQFVAKDGRILDVLLSAFGERDADNRIVRSLAVMTDVTARKLDQQRLENLLSEQKAILENDLVGIVRVRSRTIAWANPAFEKMLGYEAGELAGTPTRLNFPSEEAYIAFGAAAYPELAAGRIFRSQIEHVRKDRRHIWVDISGAILNNELQESLWGFVDITERKHLEQSIAQNEKRMDLALAGADLGMWDLDISSGSFTHNPRLITMLGYETGEPEVSIRTFTPLLYPDDAARVSAAFFAHLKGETQQFEAEYRLRHKDDHWVWILSRGKVVERDASGRAIRMTGTSLDISERKRTEAMLEAREARLATLIASMQDLVFVLDTGGTIMEYFQPAHPSRPPYKPREYLLGKTYGEILPADVVSLFDQAITGVIQDGQPRTFEYALAIESKQYISLATLSPLAGESKYPTGFLAVVRDITTERAAQQELDRVARSNKLLLESVGDGIYGVDRNYQATFLNASARAMLGFSEAEVIGKNQHSLFHHHRQDGSPYPADECPVRLTLEDGRVRREENEWFWRKDGTGFPVAVTVTPLVENDNRVGAVVIFQDVSERKANEAQIHELAFYDSLTHLPNRRLLLDRLGLALPASARRNSYGAILFLDLDDFKILNDTQGHECGDLLLVEVARRLMSCVRGEDTVARLGGDEFVVMLDDLSPDVRQATAQAAAIAEKIREALGADYSLQGHCHRCSSSIGVTLFKGADVSSGELLKRADVAMYQAKSAGRNTVRLFDANSLA
ncbi:MAG: hypothetical protein A2040_10875 [Rhodocyclales bacterium GWA2_65_19]|nr:MAG: hypothetical protein A2040_10875 [Rhodocyclales bacterium GWA2_65_19]